MILFLLNPNPKLALSQRLFLTNHILLSITYFIFNSVLIVNINSSNSIKFLPPNRTTSLHPDVILDRLWLMLHPHRHS